ncbi:hypothetical protein ACWF94_00780 [Streptomyces sp. NPDC055078]
MFAEREQVIARYREGSSLRAIAHAYDVDDKWLTGRFDAWGFPRRDHRAAAIIRWHRPQAR